MAKGPILKETIDFLSLHKKNKHISPPFPFCPDDDLKIQIENSGKIFLFCSIGTVSLHYERHSTFNIKPSH